MYAERAHSEYPLKIYPCFISSNKILSSWAASSTVEQFFLLYLPYIKLERVFLQPPPSGSAFFLVLTLFLNDFMFQDNYHFSVDCLKP